MVFNQECHTNVIFSWVYLLALDCEFQWEWKHKNQEWVILILKCTIHVDYIYFCTTEHVHVHKVIHKVKGNTCTCI